MAKSDIRIGEMQQLALFWALKRYKWTHLSAWLQPSVHSFGNRSFYSWAATTTITKEPKQNRDRCVLAKVGNGALRNNIIYYWIILYECKMVCTVESSRSCRSKRSANVQFETETYRSIAIYNGYRKRYGGCGWLRERERKRNSESNACNTHATPPLPSNGCPVTVWMHSYTILTVYRSVHKFSSGYWMRYIIEINRTKEKMPREPTTNIISFAIAAIAEERTSIERNTGHL